MKLRHLFLLPCLLTSSLTTLHAEHPVPESAQWLTYDGGDGPGQGKHIVLIAADQEYRSEQAMPMMAGILSKHHGFDCTVLFGVNTEGLVDPTMPVYPKKGEEDSFQEHDIPGLEHLEKADLVIFFPRLLTLPKEQLDLIVQYLDSGKPFLTLRTGNHGFRGPLPYEIPAVCVSRSRSVIARRAGTTSYPPPSISIATVVEANAGR